ncbi:hypothetical protein ES705_41379 [subsurface metagenome]
MPKYLCPKCQGVFFGWAMKYKYKNKCPDCGGELRKIPFNNKKLQKVIRDHKRNSVSSAK